MPEGHVIHRLAKELNTHFQHQVVEITSPQGRFAAECALLHGASVDQAVAWGKHLFIYLDNPHPEHIIHIHLGLIGSFQFEDPTSCTGQIRLRLATDTIAAHLRGPQWCRLIDEDTFARVLNKLGADPLHQAPAALPTVKTKVLRSRRSIASLLMDQSLFAGVGNIYRAESLFRLGISPFCPGRELDTRDSHGLSGTANFDALWQDLCTLMRAGVHDGRIDTVYPAHTPEAMQRPPRNDDHGGEVYVYRRAGLPCLVCGTPIAHKVMEGRNLFWCPQCQPGPQDRPNG